MNIVILNRENVNTFYENVVKSGFVAFDFETDGLIDLNHPVNNIVSVSFCYQGFNSFIYLFGKEDDNAIIECIKNIMKNDLIVKIGHNIKYDLHCSRILGVKDFKGQFHDTMIMHHIIDCNSKHDLGTIADLLFPEFSGYKKTYDRKNIKAMSEEDLLTYNSIDAIVTYNIYFIFTEYLFSDIRLYKLFRNLIAPATKVLFDMECYGMCVDKDYIENAIKETEKLLQSLDEKLRSYEQVKRFQVHRDKLLTEVELTKLQSKLLKAKKNKEEIQDKINDIKTGKIKISDPINFDSPTQLSQLLYNDIGFGFRSQVEEFLGYSDLSTSKDVLVNIRDRSGFIKNLLMYRQIRKIYTTYLVSIRDKIQDGFIHGQFNLHTTITGRLSSSDPNLQNIITRTKFKEIEDTVKYVNNSFTVSDNYTMVQADYSQAELRVMAEFSKDDNMLNAFMNDIDIHELTAANIKGISLEEFRKLPEKEYKQLRYEAKSANFGLLYLMTDSGYVKYVKVNYDMDITLKQAQQTIEKFFKNFPKIKEYHRTYIAKARKFGYVRTLFGRRVYIPEINSMDDLKRTHAERNAVNSPIQGTAGEITVFALILLRYVLPQDIKIVNTIHDSIIFYIPDNKMRFVSVIKQIMENLPMEYYFDRGLNLLKMRVDFEKSKNSWGTLEKFEAI